MPFKILMWWKFMLLLLLSFIKFKFFLKFFNIQIIRQNIWKIKTYKNLNSFAFNDILPVSISSNNLLKNFMSIFHTFFGNQHQFFISHSFFLSLFIKSFLKSYIWFHIILYFIEPPSRVRNILLLIHFE